MKQQEKPPPRRFSLEDMPKKRPATALERLIDKLSWWQLCYIIVLVIAAYTLLNWTI